jgi:transposase
LCRFKIDPGVQPNLLRFARGREQEVITMFMVGKIRRMYFRDAMSVREIVRRTGLSRNTVRTWLRAPAEKAPRYRRTSQAGKLTPFHTALEQALKADALRPKKERRTGLALYREIQAAGYSGGYSRVTDFIRMWRQHGGGAPAAFVPLTFEPGEAFQFDWSEEGVVVGGIY